MMEAVDRLHIEPFHLAILQHVKRDADACAPLRPDLAVKVGQILRFFAIDADNNVATLDSRLLRRAFGGHSGDEQPPSQLFGVEAEARPAGSRLAPSRDQVAQNRRQLVDRHEHVARRLVASADGLADDKRTDADELALAIDQRCPAPGRMGRRGEQRLLEHILPAAGEFALGDDIGPGHHGGAAEAFDQYAVALTSATTAAASTAFASLPPLLSTGISRRSLDAIMARLP